jgi:pimeloyl-ACP methyl ester carboxylesterase
MNRPHDDSLAAWRERGRVLDVFGRRVFTLEAGPAEAPALLVLHGFPTSSHDFSEALPYLADRHRVVLFDFPGFGLSEKRPEDSYSLIEQAEVALEVWRQLGIARGHLVAHDYGTSVATELLARRERGLCPIEFEGLTMCNGSMHIELAHVSLSQKLLRNRVVGPVFARLATRRVFAANMRRIFGRPDAVSDARIHAMWAGIIHDDGHLRLPAISQYLRERRRFWQRWIGPLTRLDLPTHVVWGRRDPIAVVAIAETLLAEIAGARATFLPELGHYPMLEDPRAWAAAVASFVEGPPAGRGA